MVLRFFEMMLKGMLQRWGRRGFGELGECFGYLRFRRIQVLQFIDQQFMQCF
jgi:hypothetical protein